MAKKLELNFRTVNKYWDMNPETFHKTKETASVRIKKPDEYREDMLGWLKKYPDMTTAQMFDWLEEKFDSSIDFTERTLRDYVMQLREKEGIKKTDKCRQYEALEDPPMGYQAQVDRGQIWIKNENGKRICVYCFAMVLSHSRYKYVVWQTTPFTTASFITANEKAFAFFGGRTKEIVYDQDKILAVSENSGDIIYTEGFQNYIDIMKFRVYLCRAADLETKGRVEAVVKYAKYNDADHRTFQGIDSFNEDCIAWLKRRGNGKRHEMTQKISAEVFALEKEHLIPVSAFRKLFPSDSVTYRMRKDNTILYKYNRYRVPKGTYRPNLQVKLLIEGNSMIISDFETGEIYARHTISLERGQLISLPHADRELNKKLPEVYQQVFEYFKESPMAETFLLKIKETKARYFKDQLNVIWKTCEETQEKKLLEKALVYCIQNNLFAVGDFKAAVQYQGELNKTGTAESKKPELAAKYKSVNPKVRDILEYQKVLEGKG